MTTTLPTTAVPTTTYHSTETSGRGFHKLFPPGWPLTWLFVPFPLWWVLGMSHFIFFVAAAAMAVELLRRRPVFAPMAFGLWLLFLTIVLTGVALLWVQPPGTVPAAGIGKMIPYIYHGLWYLAITIAALYVLNMPEKLLSSQRVMRLLGLMFIYTVAGGIVGLLLPTVDFLSLMEILLPVPRDGFINTLVHPTVVSTSEFLGYDQPRPTAPFSYPNAWGNNVGMFLPFFIASWLGRDAGWRRPFGYAILAVAVVPIAYSLNRGLWLGLGVALLFISIKFATMGRVRILQVTAGIIVVAALVFVSTPLYDTVSLRLNTPHSDDRRGTVATEVVESTAQLSPLLGYGETRAVAGSFESIAGGETPDCHQCAAPPLGTQGFMWRLIFTTGLLGTLFFLGFMIAQLVRFAGMQDVVALTACTAIVMSLVFAFVYDSLESPLFAIMIAIGLLNRRYVRDSQLALDPAPVVTR